MAQTKSAIKDIRQSRKRNLKNKKVKVTLKDLHKKAVKAVNKNSAEAAELIKNLVQRLDKAVKKGILHRNTAARRKSRLMKKFNLIKK